MVNQASKPRVEVRRYSPDDQPTWDNFVQSAVNGTWMHSRQFLSYHGDRFDDDSLLIYSDGQLSAVFPAARVTTEDEHGTVERSWRSHPGATYGGMLFNKRATYQLIDASVRRLLEYARRHQYDKVTLRLAEPVFYSQPCGELDAVLFQQGFKMVGRELSTAVPLAGQTVESVVGLLRNNARSAANKAEKAGVTVRLSGDFECFWGLLERNLQKHEVVPTHSLEEVLRLRQLDSERVLLVGAYLDGALIAGTVLFIMNSVAAHTMYMAQDYNFASMRALNLAIRQALVECVANDLQWLNFGISSIPGTLGMDMNVGLLSFKRGCGGHGVTRDLFEWANPHTASVAKTT